MSRVYITGIGAISAIGNDVEETFQSLIEERSGIGTMDYLESVHSAIPVFEVKLSDEELARMAGLSDAKGLTRTTLLAFIAAQQAVKDAGMDMSVDSGLRTGFISATTCGGMREFEKYYHDLLDPDKKGDFALFADTLDSADHTEKVAAIIGVKDYISTVSTACSSSSNAIILGAQLIKHGHLDRVICGGADSLCKFTINGFKILMILDSEPCRPFDQSRAGINLGEGAAYIVLESDACVKDGRTIWGELTGYSNTNDAFHQTASSPNGDGALLAMQHAIEMAGLSPAEISYINAHGTATENNDLAEGMAIQRLFGDEPPAFSSTKAYTGHTLAAAGSLEAVFSLLAIANDTVYGNLNFKKQMDELNISPVIINIDGDPIVVHHVLSNSFGFGGSNTSLLFSKVKDQ
ncbi:MAG: beta-ketoacyl-[acyl-carrier-protein] synthase family protein [Bacteroidetes bacterium]|nr:beta-ketoacyl-[acyl-carrier-protein] synthase family protein [Bacteroidota bacterium]